MNVYKPLATLSLFVLAACAPLKKPMEMPIDSNQTIAPSTRLAPSNVHDNNLSPNMKNLSRGATLSSWDISGALAARNKQKSWSATLNWLQQGPNNYQIHLMGPLGGGSVIIAKQNGIITYRDGSKKVTSTNADKLLLAQTGVQLPVESLYYWVQGIPAPGGTPLGNKPVSQFNQSGYTINYSEYMNVNGRMLPAKIRLVGHGVLIKLVIKRWRI